MKFATRVSVKMFIPIFSFTPNIFFSNSSKLHTIAMSAREDTNKKVVILVVGPLRV